MQKPRAKKAEECRIAKVDGWHGRRTEDRGAELWKGPDGARERSVACTPAGAVQSVAVVYRAAVEEEEELEEEPKSSWKRRRRDELLTG